LSAQPTPSGRPKSFGERGGFLVKAGLVSVLFATAIPAWLENKRTSSEIRSLRQELSAMGRQVSLYEREIEALRTDPDYVEYLLRTRFFYGCRNERIWRKNDAGNR
jgi:hypothetical protein